MRLLILGGTSEASALVQRLAGDRRFDVTLSLAGRTTAPIAQPVATRVGGFGGVSGLRTWLREHCVGAVVDATHPFADQISKNAVEAARAEGVALGSVVRPAWEPVSGDRWELVKDAPDAARALGDSARNVFLSVGRLELSHFVRNSNQRFLARTIDPPGDVPLPKNIRFVFERGPFGFEHEVALLRDNDIDIVVSKNSGGPATYAKIAAARALLLPVIMIERPAKPAGVALADIDSAVDWLLRQRDAHPT